MSKGKKEGERRVEGDEGKEKDKIRLMEMCDDGRFGCFYVVIMCVNVKTNR